MIQDRPASKFATISQGSFKEEPNTEELPDDVQVNTVRDTRDNKSRDEVSKGSLQRGNEKPSRSSKESSTPFSKKTLSAMQKQSKKKATKYMTTVSSAMHYIGKPGASLTPSSPHKTTKHHPANSSTQLNSKRCSATLQAVKSEFRIKPPRMTTVLNPKQQEMSSAILNSLNSLQEVQTENNRLGGPDVQQMAQTNPNFKSANESLEIKFETAPKRQISQASQHEQAQK